MHYSKQQIVESILLQSRDRDHFLEVMLLAPVLDFRQQLRFLNLVDFVEDQEHWRLRSLYQVEHVPITCIGLLADVGDHKDKVAALERFVDLAHHLVVQPCLWTMNARRVDEDYLGGGASLLRR